ncbi:MAG: hypothetical protein ACRD9S_05360 [Pyrinomonadaceae bacterium]
MKTSKHILLTVVFMLLSGFGAGVMAQNKAGAAFRLPPEPIVPVTTVNAIEITVGTMGWDGLKQETAFGYSFLGLTTGSFPGSFTLSMNCTPPPTKVANGGSVGISPIPIPPPAIEVTGGSWTLPVYMTALGGSGYAGSLYGTIAEGEMNYDKTGTKANVYVVLNVDGGTQDWDGVKGYATFAGTLFVDEKSQKTVLTGDLVFNFISMDPVP